MFSKGSLRGYGVTPILSTLPLISSPIFQSWILSGSINPELPYRRRLAAREPRKNLVRVLSKDETHEVSARVRLGRRVLRTTSVMASASGLLLLAASRQPAKNELQRAQTEIQRVEPVDACEPIDLEHYPCDEKDSESHCGLSGVSMSYERRSGSQKAAQAIDGEENDSRNEIG